MTTNPSIDRERSGFPKFRAGHFLLSTAAILVVATFPGPTYGQPAASPNGLLRVRRPIPNHYIVVLKESALNDRADNIDVLATDLAVQHSGQLGFTYRHALRGFS